jgi:prevent-host-death family protein
MIQPTDIHSITDFKRRTAALLRKIRASRRPHVLTVDGLPAIVLQDAKTYQELFQYQQSLSDAADRSLQNLQELFDWGVKARQSKMKIRQGHKKKSRGTEMEKWLNPSTESQEVPGYLRLSPRRLQGLLHERPARRTS